MFSADSKLDVGSDGAAELCCHSDELSDATDIDRGEGVVLIELLVGVVDVMRQEAWGSLT